MLVSCPVSAVSQKQEAYRKLLRENAQTALALPGVLALDVATRTRNGRVTEEPVIVVTVNASLYLSSWRKVKTFAACSGPTIE